MIQTSENYRPFPVVRSPDALVSFEVIPRALIKSEVTAQTAATAKIGAVGNVVNEVPELARKYGTLEWYGWLLDGSCWLLPTNSAEEGFWTEQVSDSDGVFSDSIKMRFDLDSPIDTFGWTFHFDAPAKVTASRVKAVWYDSENNKLGEAEGAVEGFGNVTKKAVSVAVEPVQDLHGYNNPWPAGGGKNLANVFNDGKVPSVSNGSLVNVAGTRSDFIAVTGGETYTLSSSSSDQVYIFQYGTNHNYIKYNGGNTVRTVTLESNTAYVMLRIDVSQPDTRNIQFERGSFATSYAPYSNICPISGWTEAGITVDPATGSENGETYTVSWQSSAGTVYGGTLDANGGVLTVTHGQIASYNGETLPGEWISSMDEYAPGTVPTSGAQVVYRLATPDVYNITPTDIEINTGDTVIADCGPVTLTDVPRDVEIIEQDEGGGWPLQQFAAEYSAVEFTFYGTNQPLRMLRVTEIDFGISRHFTKDSVTDVQIKYGTSVDASAFPAKELSFVFDNSDGEFNILNPVGVYQYWRNGQVLRAKIKIGDDIVNMGMFTESTAEIGKNRLLVKVKAHDQCYHLARQKYYPDAAMRAQESVTLKVAAEDVLAGYDLRINYNGLENELVSCQVNNNHPKRTMLRYLAQAARCSVWIDRDNTVQFRRFVTPDAEDAVSTITADELYDWSGVSISEEFTGCTLTVERELEGGEDEDEPTGRSYTYTSGEPDNEGVNTASYENPCVAPGQEQAVCDWLLTAANWRKKYAVKNRCDPAVEIGDAVVIEDAFHNNDAAVVTGLEVSYNGVLSCTTEAERSFA